ncbi:MAG: PAS domain S-box protein [Candidatus Tectimicrobiota bacterium]
MSAKGCADEVVGLGAPQQAWSPAPLLAPPEPSLSWHALGRLSHCMQVYEEDEALLEVVSHFVSAGLTAGEAVVVFTTAPHQEQLEARLAALGIDVAACKAQGQYVPRDAAETLAQCALDNWPDGARFVEIIEGMITHLSSRYAKVRVFGEMVALLGLDGHFAAALQLETLWNEFSTRRPLTLLCAYPLRGLARAEWAAHLLTLCSVHSHLIPAESAPTLPSPAARLGAIVPWQQRTPALASELAARQRLEQSLRHQEQALADQAVEMRERLAAIVDSSDDAIIGHTLTGIITSWNKGAARLYGYTEAEVLGQPLARLIPADLPNDLPQLLRRLQRGERIEHYETQRLHKSGARIDVSLTISPIRERTGQIIGASKIARDITARKQAEAAQQFLSEASVLLAASLDPATQLAQLARLLVPALADWCCIDLLQEDGQIHRLAVVHTDPAKARLAEQLQHDYPRLDPEAEHTLTRVMRTGQAWIDPVPQTTRLQAEARDAAHWELMQALGFQGEIVVPLVARGRVLGTLTCVRSDATRRYGPADVALAEDLARRAGLALDNARLYQEALTARRALEQAQAVLEQRVAERTAALECEMAERQQAEAQILQQQAALFQHEKLAAMSTMLASVAHELNNPLSIIMMQADILLEEHARKGQTEPMQAIAQAAERAMRIVRNFLTLARQHPLERQTVALNTVLQGALELLAYALQVDSVQVDWQLAPDLPLLWADPHQLHQVIVNLVTNAHQALREVPRPRVLTLTTRYEASQSCVLLEVADTGPGIPAAIQSEIFAPFFTTKPPGVGTGLGLPLCKGILEEHGGSIAVASQPGQGTCFRITLPVPALGSLERQTSLLEAQRAPADTAKTVLIVDDEPGIARALAHLLRRDGHTVDTASNGRLALRKLQEQPYDLILCDLRMPDLDGPGLYQALQQQLPHLLSRIIFLTGDTLSLEARAFLEQAGVPRLSKPCRAAEVRRLIAQVLQQAPA